ncbi:MAG: heat-inducible transcriptional repressor HrcA [Clostridiales bacterium]|jgi:heat-inducible transcriptional repressor|nr:heat-inducible transcriptional repressor HrcA [Clostridiales bacterium]
MGISARKEKILRAVVDSYIVSCEPISSAEIRERFLPDLSSATIRNELSALEDMGYLEQPHTSAGRVPTADAYRLYVDKLMPKKKLTRNELKTIRRYFDHKMTEIDEILHQTARVISEITNLTGVALIPDVTDAKLESVKIVKLTDSLVLIVLVTDGGILKDTTAEIAGNPDEGYLRTAGNFLSAAYQGHSLGEIAASESLIRAIKKEYEQLFKTIIKVIKKHAGGGYAGNIVLEGGAKLLTQPEYANTQKARAMLEALEAKEQLIPALTGAGARDIDINIRIGRDNEMGEGMPECAIVTANYRINGINIGNAGVIGPIRMDYSKVVSVLDYIGKTIQELPDGERPPDTDRDE